MTRKFEHADDSVVVDEITEQWKAASADRDWTSYACKLVTPLYGGGVSAGVVDQAMPVRAAALRGQLRFWWRMACAPLDDPKAMFKAESAIWGGIGAKGPAASRVRVRVVSSCVSASDLVPSDAERDIAIRYAFGPSSINGVTHWLRAGFAFQFLLDCPDACAEEVELALRWWASFGGLGARTRRGFGTVHVKDLAPVSAAMVADRGGALQLGRQGSGDPLQQWRLAVNKLFAFRQAPGVGRRAGHPRPSRSFWPEPDQIRRFFPGRDANGRHRPVHEGGNAFPRAAFGMPIRFEFPGSPRNGEPETTELLPGGGEDRMASPLVLGPYWDGQRWRRMALLLPKWERALNTPLRFKDHPFTPRPWPTNADARARIAATVAPMRERGNDPLTAFMHFFTEE
ncbi:RAMP superfamily CRISPR-associated protein [Thiohalocapsa sp. ML1]|uniref:RAMP superfamily CRISPR-associated protein n=1 Tax=Thiohalocapsa sp. ML1 TaxID=1431688 RepID=UPI0009E66A06|nr:RAMP superfamily CRISPR-associated protein [Thiohalocapsa sp. ML1]